MNIAITFPNGEALTYSCETDLTTKGLASIVSALKQGMTQSLEVSAIGDKGRITVGCPRIVWRKITDWPPPWKDKLWVKDAAGNIEPATRDSTKSAHWEYWTVAPAQEHINAKTTDH